MNRSSVNLVGNTTFAHNIGNGIGIYKNKINTNTLQFKSVSTTGASIQLIENDNEILISGTTSGGVSSFIELTDTPDTYIEDKWLKVSGNSLIYVDAPSGGTETSPAGIDGQLQFNDSGSFGGAPLHYDDSLNSFSFFKHNNSGNTVSIIYDGDYDTEVTFLRLGLDNGFNYTDISKIYQPGSGSACIEYFMKEANTSFEHPSNAQLFHNYDGIVIGSTESTNSDLKLDAGAVSLGHSNSVITFFRPQNQQKYSGLQTITGSTGGNVALESLLTALDNMNLIKNETTT